MDVSVRFSGALGIQLASMLQLASDIPNLSFATDAHYHQLVDDIIEGGKLDCQNGASSVPTEQWLGVRLDLNRGVHVAQL